jgi:hypothetical protein
MIPTVLFAMFLGAGGAAHAAGLHAGIPVDAAVDGQTAPSFQTPALGWTAGLPGGGVLRVFVGADAAAAADWAGRMAQSVQVALPPIAGLGDAAWGDGARVALATDGNVGVMVVADAEAAPRVAQALARIVDAPAAWPGAPALGRDGADWVLGEGGFAHVQVTGGRAARGGGLRFTTPPTAILAWDGWGRPVEARVEAGAVVEVGTQATGGALPRR